VAGFFDARPRGNFPASQASNSGNRDTKIHPLIQSVADKVLHRPACARAVFSPLRIARKFDKRCSVYLLVYREFALGNSPGPPVTGLNLRSSVGEVAIGLPGSLGGVSLRRREPGFAYQKLNKTIGRNASVAPRGGIMTGIRKQSATGSGKAAAPRVLCDIARCPTSFSRLESAFTSGFRGAKPPPGGG
jgi:hypothetical protein